VLVRPSWSQRSLPGGSFDSLPRRTRMRSVSTHRRQELRCRLTRSITKHGATGTKGRTGDARRGTGDASRERSRISRHRRNPFAGSDLVRPVTRVTRVTRNRGPFPGGGCGGDQTRLIRHTGPPAQAVDAPSSLSPKRGEGDQLSLPRNLQRQHSFFSPSRRRRVPTRLSSRLD
jgi:hypothetical protein